MRLGIVGGGQLGMFLVLAAKKRGLKTIVLDPNPKCSASNYADKFICASFTDEKSIGKLFEDTDYVTYEFENINLDVLLQNDLQKLVPRLNSLLISQDRLLEKQVAQNSGLKVGKFYAIDDLDDLRICMKKLNKKGVLKTRRFGYDGKGQAILESADYEGDLLQVPCILEEYLDFDYEVSLIGARNLHGEFSFLSLNINEHLNHILFKSVLTQSKKYETILERFMEINNLYGILTIEFFVVDGELYFNEIAPRPHNSGHSSLDVCTYSQYDLAISAIIDDTFSSNSCKSATMFNILGSDIEYFRNNELENVMFYDYFKEEVRDNRKMGHLTTSDEKQIKKLEEYWMVDYE